LRRLLRGEELVLPHDHLTTRQTLPQGQVEAILAMIRRLDLDSRIASQRSPERDLVVAMVAQHTWSFGLNGKQIRSYSTHDAN
jgi:hypothetical protein